MNLVFLKLDPFSAYKETEFERKNVGKLVFSSIIHNTM